MKPGDLIRDTATDKYGYIISVERGFYGTTSTTVPRQDRFYIKWFKNAPYTVDPDYNTSYEPEVCLEIVSEC